MIQLGREAAQNWKYGQEEISDSIVTKLDFTSNRNEPRSNADTTATLALPGWKESLAHLLKQLLSDLPSTTTFASNEVQVSSTSLPSQASNEDGEGLKRQPSKREIARTEMMRKLSVEEEMVWFSEREGEGDGEVGNQKESEDSKSRSPLVGSEQIETLDEDQDPTNLGEEIQTSNEADIKDQNLETSQTASQKPILPPLSLNHLNSNTLNIPQTLSPSIALSPSESIASISTSASPTKVYDGSDNETETGSQWDGESEIDLDAYMRDSDSEEEESEEEEPSSEEARGREGENRGLGISSEKEDDKAQEIEVQPLKPQVGESNQDHISISRPAGAGHHHRSSSVLEDLGEKPSERLQAILGASFVQLYGDAAYFDQPSPMEFGEEKRLGWKPEDSSREVEKERQMSMDSLTPSEVLPIKIQDTRKVQEVEENLQKSSSFKPPVPQVPIPKDFWLPSTLRPFGSSSHFEITIASSSSSFSDSKTPVSNSHFAHWQSQGPIPQFDSTREVEAQAPANPLSSAKPLVEAATVQQQSQGGSSSNPSPVVSHGQGYHPPPASSAQLASFYADDKLRPFPGFVAPQFQWPDSDVSSRSTGRIWSSIPVNSPSDLGSNSNTISRAPSNKTTGFFSSLRRKASGAQIGGGGTASPSSRLFGSALHKRSGSALSLSSAALPSQVQADRSKIHSRSMSVSSVASSRQPDQSFNSVNGSPSTRQVGTSSPVQGFDSEKLANGKAEHLRSEEDTRDNLEVQYALEPSTAAKLQRYSQMLTNPISPADYPSSSPLRSENVIPDLPMGAAEGTRPWNLFRVSSDPPRRLIKAGPIYQVVSDTMVKDRFLVLFDDLLVIAKPIAPPLPSSKKAADSSPPNPVLADLEWTFSAKSMVELHPRQVEHSERGQSLSRRSIL
ncbi:hypothetical protein L7F22_037963 [Adiantum nelumboides]|nr:hypothetical protein [Adiantum nelumboides]